MPRASREYDDLPREHVLRPSLPWREEWRTECGREADEDTLTREELAEKVRKQGPSRAKLTTCITCFDTAQRWPDWDRNPSAVISREVRNVSYWTGEELMSPFNQELIAIGLLIEAHREEFDQILEALRSAVPLVQRRRPSARQKRL